MSDSCCRENPSRWNFRGARRGRLVGPDAERLTYENLETLIQNDYIKKERRSMERLDASLKALGSFFSGAGPRHHGRPCGRLHRVSETRGPSEQYDQE